MSENWEFSPHSREEIIRDLRQALAQTEATWARSDDTSFFRPLGGGWSPAQNAVHLTQSTRPVATALGLPKWILGLLFGRAGNPSSSYAALRARYQEVLAKGGGAGRFSPRELPPPSEPRPKRARLVADLEAAVATLARRVETWSETDLDLYRLPHPLLGKLTIREMLLFTVQHLAHHGSKVAERLDAVA